MVPPYRRKHGVLVTSKRKEIECKTIRVKGKGGKGYFKKRSQIEGRGSKETERLNEM